MKHHDTITRVGDAVEMKIVPSSGVVWAPETWRGHTIHVIIGNYTITKADDAYRVTATDAYHRESHPATNAHGPCYITIRDGYEGVEAVLLRGETNAH